MMAPTSLETGEGFFLIHEASIPPRTLETQCLTFALS